MDYPDFPNIPTEAIYNWPRGASLVSCNVIKDMSGETHRVTVLTWVDNHGMSRVGCFSIENHAMGQYIYDK